MQQQKKKQIPPLRCGMTTKNATATATATATARATAKAKAKAKATTEILAPSE
jgi:hypothetical protein